jgi:DNA-binding transcriptional regulator YiaG
VLSTDSFRSAGEQGSKQYDDRHERGTMARNRHEARAGNKTCEAYRLAEIRRARGPARQADVAAIMGVSRARISKLESGDPSHTELGTLQSYVAALGGTLRIVADFGDEAVELLRHAATPIAKVNVQTSIPTHT